MKRNKRKTPTGLESGYLDTIEAFERFTDWGDAPRHLRQKLCAAVADALPIMRSAALHPVEFQERLAILFESTPEPHHPQLWQALQIAALLVDAEKRPGRIAKTKAKGLNLRIATTAELNRVLAARKRL